MRRIAVILAGLGALSAGIGCQHTAGRCDCWPITSPCLKYGLYTSDTGAIHDGINKAEALPVPPVKKEIAK